MRKEKSIIEESSLIEDENYNEERINDIVKASDLLNNHNIGNKNTSSEDNSRNVSISKRVLYPFYEQYPEMKKYAPEGKIVDIKFDDEFEEKLHNKNIIELSNTDSIPKIILLTIQPNSDEDSFTKRIDVNDDQDKFNNIVKHYGDGNLDSLISSSIILKPSDKYNRKYDIFIPENTATSKLKAKIHKLYSTHMKRGEKRARFKFFTLNSLRAVISIIQMSIIFLLIYSLTTFNNIPNGVTVAEYIEGIFAWALGIFSIFCIYLISLHINEHCDSGNSFVGAFGLGIYVYLKDIYKYFYKKFMNINKTLGKLIKIN